MYLFNFSKPEFLLNNTLKFIWSLRGNPVRLNYKDRLVVEV
jgi:hypothetical protein